MKPFMKQLTKIRKQKRISYFEIEKETGIPFARMQRLESGKSHVTVDEMEKLLGLYEVSLDQVLVSIRRQRRVAAALAALVSAVLLFCAFRFTPLPDVPSGMPPHGERESAAAVNTETAAASSPGQPGDLPETAFIAPESGTEPETGAFPDSAAVPDSAAEAAGVAGAASVSGERTANGPSTAAGQAEATGASLTDAAPEAAPAESLDIDREETTVFRFWGNIPYHAERLPEAGETGDARIIDVFPVRHLDDEWPDWLAVKDKERLILNFGTTEVWTPTTLEGYEALQRDGYRVTGLGKVPDVYEPLIVEAGGRKIGFLSLTGLIRHAEEVALPTRAGLPRAYRTDEVTDVVKAAKAKADYLFVLIDWGKTYGQTPNTSQRLIGRAILMAGGDCVIGNRPVRAQDVAVVDGKPLFYALGHAVADDAGQSSYNLMVEAAFSGDGELERMSVVGGKLADGVLSFDLTEEDLMHVADKYANAEALPDYMEWAW